MAKGEHTLNGPLHSFSIDEVARLHRTDQSYGLSGRDARQRLRVDGPNKITRRDGPGVLAIFLSEFRDPMVITLLLATVISGLMGELVDAVVIASIVALNAMLGTLQEYRAERSLEALENYAPPKAWVVRGGSIAEIDREAVVRGDLIALWPGVRVPADGRLVQARSLQVEEAALTGESLPVSKLAGPPLPEKTPLPDRKNMVYAGTLVTRGEGRAIVSNTGMSTEMGRIARLVQAASGQKTPLEGRLESLGRTILLLSVGVCVFIASMGLGRGLPFRDMFLMGVSLAVAAVPEGLPAVVTVSLAFGVQRMARKGAIVRKLEAIETLGSVTVICTDKTGTLTENVMALERVAYRTPGGQIRDFSPKDRTPEIAEILRVALLASDARHLPDDTGVTGEDPTEQAIVVASWEAGIDVEDVDFVHPRLAEKAFSAERRAMSVKVKAGKSGLVCLKGAPDKVIPLSATERLGSKRAGLQKEQRAAWDSWVNSWAEKGMRILAVAAKTVEGDAAEYSEEGLELLGCIAMADPVRAEAEEAVGRCKRAGIRPVLVTGDHLRTAENVALATGIITQRGTRCMTGAELDDVVGADLASRIDETRVFARVSPDHKLRIVKALKSRGNIVAMTGDGVNDAPALKEAAVGVAMGVTGTDVAREASAMVLTDDNFSTIVSAVSEGRGIYDNIRKFIRYLFSCNIGEVLVMMGAVGLGLPVPISPTQMLWVNLVTDGLPALALSMDPPEKDIMTRPPRDPGEGLFSHGLLRRIFTRGTYIGAITLVLFLSGRSAGDFRVQSTLAFATLITTQLVAAFDCRSETISPLEAGIFSNPYLVMATLSSFLMLVATIHVPHLARLFGTVPLSFAQWATVFMASLLPDAFGAAFASRKLKGGDL